jgi:predicted metalloprotease with PDZ domain
LQDLSDIDDVCGHSLNDPVVRDSLYAPGRRFGDLAYTKGAQVSMLLDRATREASGGRVSLDRVVAATVRTFDGGAFYKPQYIECFRTMAGADVTEIFRDFVDAPGAIPDSVLRENYRWLCAAGAFGDSSCGAAFAKQTGAKTYGSMEKF